LKRISQKFIILTSFLLLTCIAHAQRNLHHKITLSIDHSSIKAILDTISKQTGLSFFYSSDLINPNKMVSVHVKNKSLKEVLHLVINDDRLLVMENGNQIIITENRQRNYTLSGTLLEKGSGELLIGVSVSIPALASGGTTNQYGFYSITLPVDSYTVVYSYVGYTPVIKKIYLDKNIQLDMELVASSTLGEVVVHATENKFSNATLSTITVPLAEISKLPSLLGEQDAIKYLMLMPGVQKGNEGNNGMYVRGGGPDQNLVMIDDAIIYNSYHLLGVNSLFTGSELKKSELTKGGFPARHGGRLSSVLDMSIKDGNRESYAGEAAIGLISSRLMFEGPIAKNKASFFVSLRRNYIDYISKIIDPVNGTGFYYYDVHAKCNVSLNEHNRLYASTYFGSDRFYVSGEIYSSDEMSWVNRAATLRWNHIFNSKIFANTSFIYSEYINRLNYGNVEEAISSGYSYQSGIRDFSAKFDLQFWASLKHTFRSGLIATHHRFSPRITISQVNLGGSFYSDNNLQKDAQEGAMYIEDEILLTRKLKLNAGLRWSYFYIQNTLYTNPEPRISGVYSLPRSWFVSASYTWMNQYMHLLSASGFGLPIDMWLPATADIKPQQSQLVTAGFTKRWEKWGIELSVEGYYKKTDHIIGFKEGTGFSYYIIPLPGIAQTNFDDLLTQGQSWAYGTEYILRKTKGRFTGWVSYTLSWTQFQFPDVNLGKTFYATYDRRHDLAIVGMFQISKKFGSSVSWVYGTGNAISLPNAEYSTVMHDPQTGNTYNALQAYDYGTKNAYRMIPYHRLDVSLRYESKIGNRLKSIIELSVYNVYNRANAFYYQVEDNGNGKRIVKLTSLFPVIPSLSWTVKF
jgi:hypothetical protein